MIFFGNFLKRSKGSVSIHIKGRSDAFCLYFFEYVLVTWANLKITKYIFKEMMNIKSISRMRLTKIKTTSISQQLNRQHNGWSFARIQGVNTK